jgi:hypothetical protein
MKEYYIHPHLNSLEPECWECARQPLALLLRRYRALQVPGIPALVDVLSLSVRDRPTQTLIQQGLQWGH